MPVDVVITPPLWTDMHESEMKLKIRVRRIKEGRELRGGFPTFSSCFPDLCENRQASILPLSLSQPCLPVANLGPTRILSHLYLGSQKDVLNKELMAQNGITYVLNASNTCPKPEFISESHFLRVPVNDSYCEKLLPWLDKTNQFIEKAKMSNCRVIVHCLAGISRSATIAIAYIMKTMGLSSDDAYRFVKDRRPSISPNFNFLGQLLEFERDLKLKTSLTCSPLRSTPEHPEKITVEQNIPKIQRNQETTVLKTKPPSPTSLQKDLSSLHLSRDQTLQNHSLKCSISLDIKSVCSRQVSSSSSQSDLDNMPKRFQLESPKNTNNNTVCSQFSSSSNIPNSNSESWMTESKLDRQENDRFERILGHQSHQDRPENRFERILNQQMDRQENVRIEKILNHQMERQENGRFEKIWNQQMDRQENGKFENILNHQMDKPERISTKTLTLNLSRNQLPAQNSKIKTPSFLNLPLDSSSIWTKHRSLAQASTPVTPTEERPWFYASNLDDPSSGVQMSWDKPQLETKFKRRSCQMEFEEIIGSSSASAEDFGKLGKQNSFSGSMEVIGVS